MYRKSNKGWSKHIDFLIIDMISLEVAYFLAYMIRHGLYSNLIMRRSYFRMIFVLLLIDFVSVAVMQTFSGVIRRGYYEEFTSTFKQAIAVTVLSTLYLFSIQEGEAYSRITLFLTGGLYLLISYIFRCAWKMWLQYRTPLHRRSLIIISTPDEAEHIIETFNRHNYSNIGISGLILTDQFLDKNPDPIKSVFSDSGEENKSLNNTEENKTGQKISGVEIVANQKTAEEYILSHWVDEVLIGINVDREQKNQFMKTLLEMGITVHQSLLEVENNSPIERNIERIGGYTVITRSVKILTTAELAMKRLLDILGGIAGCILTGILFLFVAPAIYIASPGPIFFTQERIGKNGKTFKMYKFRSMYLDAEDRLSELKKQNKMKDDFMFKLDYDPRIIGSEKGQGKGIGNFIRRTSIDGSVIIRQTRKEPVLARVSPVLSNALLPSQKHFSSLNQIFITT